MRDQVHIREDFYFIFGPDTGSDLMCSLTLSKLLVVSLRMVKLLILTQLHRPTDFVREQ